MEFSLQIDKATCIKCGKCVKVCPAYIFKQESANSEIQLYKPETCIQCGHCVAVCPTSSVIHSTFPPEKVHRIDKDLLPSPAHTLTLIRSRRSNRAFSGKTIPADYFDIILEAAYRAPTASNLQQVRFTLVTDPGLLHRISSLTIQTLFSKTRVITHPLVRPLTRKLLPSLYHTALNIESMKQLFDDGCDKILRGASAVILIHTPENVRFGCQDANLAYQNASLMAESLGVCQFYTGFVCIGIAKDRKKRIQRLLGIDGTIHAGMALGMPAFSYPNYIDRKEMVVDRL